MKLATTLVLATSGVVSAKTAVDVTAAHKMSGKATRSLVRASRKLDDQNNQNQEEEDEFYFLKNYRIKYVSCFAGTQVAGEDMYESSAVQYRLCPLTDVESKSAFGCTDEEAYGDYVVGINTFTEAIAQNIAWEQEQAGYENNDEFNLEEYARCAEADMDMEQNNNNQNDEGRKLEQEQFYFIGPKCVEVMEGKKVVATDIAMGFFTDEACAYEAEGVSYYELTGMEIPYSSGLGLYQEAVKCESYNDNGEMEIKEICQRLLEEPAYRCDAVYQGGCDYIEELDVELKKAEAGMSGGMKFLIALIVIGVLGGAAWFFYKKKQKKDALLGSQA